MMFWGLGLSRPIDIVIRRCLVSCIDFSETPSQILVRLKLILNWRMYRKVSLCQMVQAKNVP